MLDPDPPIVVENRVMHVILKKDNPTLDNALPLGGGLTLLESPEQADTWKKALLTPEKRDDYRVDEVTITHRIVPEKDGEES